MTPDFLMFLKTRVAKENMKATNRPTWGQQAEPRGFLIWTNVGLMNQKGGFLYGPMWSQLAKRGAPYMDQHGANEPKGGASYMDQRGANKLKGGLFIWTNIGPTNQKGGFLYETTWGQPAINMQLAASAFDEFF